MDLYILDTDFNAISILDYYESLIWTERYYSEGDFEIYTTARTDVIETLKEDNYIWSKDSEDTMIIEQVQLSSDVENGDEFIVTGRSLASILHRRIIWAQTVLSGNFQDAIEKLLNENIINPIIPERKIENFIFQKSTDERITSLTIESAQYFGEDLYDVVSTLCETKEVGFKVVLSSENQFIFSLYVGEDRSYDQFENPYVIFSPDFDNIINSNYLESKKTLKTVTLVAGEGEGSERKTVVVPSDTTKAKSGLNRRELFSDAGDISSSVDGETISASEYNAQLTQRGEEELSKNITTKSFEGEVDTTQLFQYGVDFYKGDIVQIVNEYGIEGKSRIIEIVRSQDDSGIDILPTFAAVE